MATLRLGFGWNEIVLSSEHASLSEGGDRVSADEIRRRLAPFLGHSAEMAALRGMIAEYCGEAVIRMSDHCVIETVAQRCEFGTLRLRRCAFDDTAAASTRPNQGMSIGSVQSYEYGRPGGGANAIDPGTRARDPAPAPPVHAPTRPVSAVAPAAPKAPVALLPDPPTWVEVRLIGEDGRPIAGMGYRFVAMDGVVHLGVTDHDGVGRVDGIRGARGSFTFPTLDQDAWRHV